MGFWGRSGISWTIGKQSAPCSKQITTPNHSIFTRQMPYQQCQTTEYTQSHFTRYKIMQSVHKKKCTMSKTDERDSQMQTQLTHFAHRRGSVLNLQQQRHDLALLSLLRCQTFLVHVHQQLVKVLHVIRLHRRQVSLWLKVHHLRLAVGGLHAEPHRRAGERRRRRRQLASRRSDWDVSGRRLQNLHSVNTDHRFTGFHTHARTHVRLTALCPGLAG